MSRGWGCGWCCGRRSSRCGGLFEAESGAARIDGVRSRSTAHTAGVDDRVGGGVPGLFAQLFEHRNRSTSRIRINAVVVDARLEHVGRSRFKLPHRGAHGIWPGIGGDSFAIGRCLCPVARRRGAVKVGALLGCCVLGAIARMAAACNWSAAGRFVRLRQRHQRAGICGLPVAVQLHKRGVVRLVQIPISAEPAGVPRQARAL